MSRYYAFYIMSNRRDGDLYHGCTDNLIVRQAQHRGIQAGGSSYCKKMGIEQLVYYELYPTRDEALQRERRVKRWLRAWKVELIEARNPEWVDLWPSLMQQLPVDTL